MMCSMISPRDGNFWDTSVLSPLPFTRSKERSGLYATHLQHDKVQKRPGVEARHLRIYFHVFESSVWPINNVFVQSKQLLSLSILSLLGPLLLQDLSMQN